MSVMPNIVRRFTYPVEAPIASLTWYYALLFGVTAGVLYLVPELAQAFSGERLRSLAAGQGPMSSPEMAADAFTFSWHFALLLGVAMVGSLLLMVPASWVYMATRRRKGFDQKMVQTIVVLALSVAGVVVIVRNSLALAFSLAGIVGAIRFRNTLPDTRDTLYVFLSIAVGLAAGVEALAAAAVLSMIFNYTVLLMHRVDYGMCELGRPAGHLRLMLACFPPAERGIAGSGAAGNGKKRKARDFNAVLLVRAKGAEPARQAVESFLGRETKAWQLAEMETNGKNQESVLKYLVRLGKRSEPAAVEDALLELGKPHVIGARIH